jgi:hypothetical protein
MINQWWFRLYTIDFIKSYLKFTLIAILVEVALGIVGLREFAIAAYLPLWRLLFLNYFRTNLEFHKMHIPYPELKKGFLINNLIRTTLFFMLFFVHLLCSYLIGEGEEFILIKMMTKEGTGVTFLTCAFAICFLLYHHIVEPFHAGVESKYQFLSKKTFLDRFVKVPFFVFCIGILYLSLVDTTNNIWVGMCIVGAALFLGLAFFHSRALFNQIPHHGKLRQSFVYFLGGLIPVSLVFILVLFSGRHEVNDDSLPVDKRVSSFKFNGHLNPPIDIETFKVIEPTLGGEYNDSMILYGHLDGNASYLGLEYFLDKRKGSERLLCFLLLGKPTPEFLTALYDHFERHPEFWLGKSDHIVVRNVSYKIWPRHIMLPEKYLSAKINSKNLYDNSVLKKKIDRDIAGQR